MIALNKTETDSIGLIHARTPLALNEADGIRVLDYFGAGFGQTTERLDVDFADGLRLEFETLSDIKPLHLVYGSQQHVGSLSRVVTVR